MATKAFALTEKDARWVVQQANMRQGTTPPTDIGTFREPYSQTIIFRNDSGETVPAYGVVRVTGYASANERHAVTVTKPASLFGWFLVNGREQVPSGECGVAFSGPFVRVIYDSADSPTNGQVYGVDGFKARSFNSGKPIINFVMLGVLNSTAKIAFALIEPMQQAMVKAPSGGIPGRVGTLLGSATCDVVTAATSNAQLATSSVQLTVYNWAKTSACKTGDRYGLAGLVNGRWMIAAEDCNDTGSTIQGASSGGTLSSVTSPIQTSSMPKLYSFGNFHQVRFSSTATGGGFE